MPTRGVTLLPHRPSACAAAACRRARRCAAVARRAGRGRAPFGTMTLARRRRADDDVLVLRRNEVGRQRRLQPAEHRHSQDDAGDRATTAEDRDAAEQDDRDDEELHARRPES